MTTTLERDARTPALSRGQLPSWGVGAIGAAALVITAGLVLLTPLAGWVAFIFFAIVIFCALLTAVSWTVEGRRRATDRLVTTVVYSLFATASLPLGLVAYTVISYGAERFDGNFFGNSMRNIGARDAEGGAYHAIVGTLQQVGIATLITVPLGILAAIYIVEYGRGRLAALIRFFVDVMTGIPSIIAGLFVLAFWVLALGQGFSGFAASLALVVLMLPTVVRSAEEMLRLVPDALREGAYALGVPKWKTIMRIVLPTALPGLITGIMLAIARVAGETAPVLVTAGGIDSINFNVFEGNQSSLPLMIYQEQAKGLQFATDRAWAAALTLIILVMTLNLLARLVARRSRVSR